MPIKNNAIKNSILGRKAQYKNHYDSTLLYPISRSLNREKRQFASSLPFSYGYDTWNAYELSWLNNKGKPEVAIGRFIFPYNSDNLIESKSLKLYLNSFNNSRFSSMKEVEDTIAEDLSKAACAHVFVELLSVEQYQVHHANFKNAKLLDHQDIDIDCYTANTDFLSVGSESVTDYTVYSHLLKSNCLVTHQPDWATVCITYSGIRIDESGLLKYIVSLRNDNEFHEDCVEHIFNDVMMCCYPSSLTVSARYTRRGGLDINPIRSTDNIKALDCARTSRQ